MTCPICNGKDKCKFVNLESVRINNRYFNLFTAEDWQEIHDYVYGEYLPKLHAICARAEARAKADGKNE